MKYYRKMNKLARKNFGQKTDFFFFSFSLLNHFENAAYRGKTKNWIYRTQRLSHPPFGTNQCSSNSLIITNESFVISAVRISFFVGKYWTSELKLMILTRWCWLCLDTTRMNEYSATRIVLCISHSYHSSSRCRSLGHANRSFDFISLSVACGSLLISCFDRFRLLNCRYAMSTLCVRNDNRMWMVSVCDVRVIRIQYLTSSCAVLHFALMVETPGCAVSCVDLPSLQLIEFSIGFNSGIVKTFRT